jgi:hypothetical protein
MHQYCQHRRSVSRNHHKQATTLTALVDVDFSSLGTAVWSPGTVSGDISFCYKLSATVSGQVVSDARIQITATVDLENDTWSVSNIDATESAPSVAVALNVAVDYTLTSFICNDAGVLVAAPAAIIPGGSLQVCVTYPSGVSGVSVGSIYEATISQTNGPSLQTISTGTVQHDFTSVDCSSVANTCRIKTNVVRNFFTSDTKNLTISGTALMKIGRRMVRVPVVTRRSSEITTERSKVGAFSLDFRFDPEETTSDTRHVKALAAITAFSVTATVLALL